MGNVSRVAPNTVKPDNVTPGKESCFKLSEPVKKTIITVIAAACLMTFVLGFLTIFQSQVPRFAITTIDGGTAMIVTAFVLGTTLLGFYCAKNCKNPTEKASTEPGPRVVEKGPTARPATPPANGRTIPPVTAAATAAAESTDNPALAALLAGQSANAADVATASAVPPSGSQAPDVVAHIQSGGARGASQAGAEPPPVEVPFAKVEDPANILKVLPELDQLTRSAFQNRLKAGEYTVFKQDESGNKIIIVCCANKEAGFNPSSSGEPLVSTRVYDANLKQIISPTAGKIEENFRALMVRLAKSHELIHPDALAKRA